MGADYKVQLPQTDFPMKADLPKREPGILQRWDAEKIFTKILAARAKEPIFAFHDGPPYANGHIHQGHILNKVLKDIVVKSKTMAGFLVDYVPGWDCHGLPIEQALEKDMGAAAKAAMDRVSFRQACREYAARFVDIQRTEFKRLGVFGRWEEPYLTMEPGYEAIIAREFGRFLGNGGAYKGKRPVHWCWHDKTALAEAEVEHEPHESPSIWVKFPLPEDTGVTFAGKKTYVVIWTTTPWTLPANLGISFNPEFKYVAIEPTTHPGEAWIVADGLRAKFLEETGTLSATVLGVVDVKALDNKNARHPFMDRQSRLLLGDHVTLEAGTGCVHTAPGHGVDDFAIGRRYGLEILTPVNDGGVLTDEAGPFAGQFIFKANPLIIERLRADGMLVAAKKVTHEYPHCWRCKKPVIFRATTQWFISMEKNDLRKKALEAIDQTRWIPAWGRERIHGMVAKRPDWCISRQRVWGVPIVAFRCNGCGESHATQALVDKVAKLFETEGADAWFAHRPSELIGNEKCPKCGKSDWKTEDDILDVWFESGVSFAAVCEPRKTLGFPVDLYLEGSDQHRGWFHSTLLASVGTRGRNAYKQCLTHGFVVASDGTKMSKSKGNYVALEKVLEESGADLLRLWVAASDYRDDIRVSKEILATLGESYRKIRNTARGLLQNLAGFDPDTHGVPVKEMTEVDRYLLSRTAEVVDQVRAAYEAYEFHTIVHTLVNFCSTDLSAFYIDVTKDRLYCDAPKAPARRSTQTAYFEILRALTNVLAPILAFTSEEIWTAMPKWKGKAESVHLEKFPEVPAAWRDEALANRWKKLLGARKSALEEMEVARAAKLIGKADDAAVTLGASGDLKKFLTENAATLREAFSVSALRIVEDPAAKADVPTVKIEKAPGEKCPRCRRWYERLESTGLCARCTAAEAVS